MAGMLELVISNHGVTIIFHFLINLFLVKIDNGDSLHVLSGSIKRTNSIFSVKSYIQTPFEIRDGRQSQQTFKKRSLNASRVPHADRKTLLYVHQMLLVMIDRY